MATKISGTLYYLRSDPLGSISVTTDGSQTVQGTRNYLPFGMIRTRSGSLKTDYAFASGKLDLSDSLLYYPARD